MECVSPPELDESSLWTYVDDEADQETMRHLELCEFCRGRAKDLAQLRERFRSRVYRINCPPSLELGEYHLHMLPASRALIVAQHLRECQHCTRELAQLEGFLGALARETDLLGQVKIVVAKLISGKEMDQESGQSAMTPAYTGLRGEEDVEPFIYQVDHIQIVVEVQDDVEQIGRKILLGLVTGLESNEFTIQASQEDQVVATTSVDEIGNFIIAHLLPGHYALILSGPNIEIHIQSLQVR